MRLGVSFFVIVPSEPVVDKGGVRAMNVVMLRLLKYLRPSAKWVALSTLLLVFGTIVDLVAPWLLKEVFDKGIANKNVTMILGFTLALAGIQVAKSVAMYMQSRSQELVGQNVVFKLREEMYDHLQRLSFGYYDKAQTGQLMSRMTGDIESVKNFIGFGAMADVHRRADLRRHDRLHAGHALASHAAQHGDHSAADVRAVPVQ